MSNNKAQISPIPPENYGDRFIKFMSGLTMTKEEQERHVESGEQLDGTSGANPRTSIQRPSISHDNEVVEKAEKEAHKSEQEGGGEQPQRDRTLSAVRSPSAERGMAGATLPVVEEDGEANSQEGSLRAAKASPATPTPLPPNEHQPSAIAEKEGLSLAQDQSSTDKQLLSLPNFNRLSLGLQPNVSTAK